MSEVKTGIFRGMTVPEYESIPAMRWSRLKHYLRSAAHGRAAESQARRTDDLDFGQALHTAVLEPGLFEEQFGVIPEDAPPKRSNEDKRWWAEFYEANKTRTMLKRETFEAVKLSAESAYAHPRANLWLTSPKSTREVSIVWMDPEFGMYCKARLDLVSNVEGVSRVIDLKSTRDASRYGFGREISTYNYAGQLAWYRRGLYVLAPFDRSAAFIAIEKEPPFVAVCYDLGAASSEVGDLEVRRAVATYLEANRLKSWPGYEDGVIELPAWKLKEE